jgi:hypothetical protein
MMIRNMLLASLLLTLLSSVGHGQSGTKICPTCLPKNDGDFFHREDNLTPGWIGHAGVKLTPKNSTQSAIYDFNVGRPPGRALQGINFDQWLSGQPFWGAKRSALADLKRVKMMSNRLSWLLSIKTEYDDTHNNQKGETFTDGNGEIYFEADCVGFVEGLHEFTRDELTPRDREGVILLVQTQRDASYSLEVGR